jgi:group I intron endonuclease
MILAKGGYKVKTSIKNIPAVYKFTCLPTKRIYIGSSIMCLKRKNEHYRDLRNNRHHCTRLQRAYNVHGKSNLIFEVLEYCNYEEIIQREQHYLDTLLFAQEYINSGRKDNRFRILGMNIKPIAGSSLGHKWSMESRLKITGRKRSEEFKAKLSKSLSGENHPLFGTKLSDKHKKIFSDMAKERVGEKNHFYGKVHSSDTKLRMSLAKLNNPVISNNKPVICLNLLNGVFTDYISISDAAKDFNYNRCIVGEKLRKNLPYKNKLFFYA